MNTNTTSTDPNQLFGDDVITSDGSKVGTVDGVWVDDASDQPEFIAVKTGMIFGKNHLMPIEQAQIDTANQTIQVPYSEDQIKGGPTFGTEDSLSPADEQSIYDYYGMQRSTDASPSGYAGSGTGVTDTANTLNSGITSGRTDLPTPPTDEEFTTSEEQLQVGKRTVQTGQVRLRKVVRTEHQEVPVDLRREEVQIERVPASEVAGATADDNAFQEGEIDIPVMEEQAVVGKQTVATGGVRVTKGVETQTETVGGDVRRTDVEVDEDGNIAASNPPIQP